MINIFVSSTFNDLKNYRKAVRKGIRQLGAIDVSMENLGARDNRPKDECIRLIENETDVFVGIYAHRYGFIPDGDDISITEAEYNAAVSLNIPCYIYILDEEYPWLIKYIDLNKKKSKLGKFKQSLLNRHICKLFTTKNQLTSSVVADLGRYLTIKSLGLESDNPVLQPTHSAQSSNINTKEAKSDLHKWRRQKHTEIQDYSREIYLGHILAPSSTAGAVFDVFIYLDDRGTGEINKIKKADFFLGKGFDNQIVKGEIYDERIGRWFSCYGEFLCTCLIKFKDGEEALISRYIDFDMGDLLEKLIDSEM